MQPTLPSSRRCRRYDRCTKSPLWRRQARSNHEAFQLRVEGDPEVPRQVFERGVDDAEVVAEGERAEARDEHARQNPHEQLAALQGLKLGFGLTSLEVGGG